MKKQKRMRTSCVNEVIETEKDFVLDLGICIQFFLAPAKQVFFFFFFFFCG